MTDQPPGPGRMTIAAATLAPLRAIIGETGIAAADVLDAAGLDAALFAPGSDAEISLAGYFRLNEQLALAIGDEAIHVSLRPLMLGTSDFIRDRLRAAKSVGEMLDLLAGSYNVIHGGPYNQVRRLRGELVFAMDDSDFPYAIDREDPFILFSLEALLVYVHVLLQSSSTSAEPLPLRSVRTRWAARSAESPLAPWGVPVSHGARCFELRYDEKAADWPVDPAACPVLGARTIYGGIARALDRLATPGADGAGIVERLTALVHDGVPDQRAAARRLGMSPASLRRRLAEHGTSFRELRAAALRDTAAARLRRGEPIADIAEDLGFSDGRSFARAFRSWTGRSPREYRARSRTD